MRRAPHRAEVRCELGNVLLRQGHFDQARKQFANALENDPKHAPALVGLGQALAQQGKSADAVAAFRAAAQLEPGVSRRHSDLALALADDGKADEAKKEYKEATRLDAGWVEAVRRSAWEMLRRKDLRAGEGFLALYLARQACGETSRPKAELLDTLAAAYAEVGRFEEAAATARTALALAQSGMQTELARKIQGCLARYERRQPMARE
jgi:Flp pilus assembly protein TadD